MKRIFIITALFAISLSAMAVEITRMEPAFWWVGMKNPELQILVQGKNIAQSQVQLDYPGVRIKDIVKPENPDYLFIYLEIGNAAQPGQVKLTFTEGKKKLTKNYELKPRASTIGAQGFNASDVMYLIMPDRFANADPSNDVWDGVPIEREDPFGRHGGDLAGIEAHLDYLDNLGITFHAYINLRKVNRGRT